MDKLLFAACFIRNHYAQAEKMSQLNICLEQTFWILAIDHAKNNYSLAQEVISTIFGQRQCPLYGP